MTLHSALEMVNYFLRTAEIQALEAIPPNGSSSMELIVARSGLSPTATESALASLVRRRFVGRRGESEFRLTPDGQVARQELGQASEAGESPLLVFLDDAAESDLQTLSEVETALDALLGPDESGRESG